MVLVEAPERASRELVAEPFPADVEFVISALEAGPRPLIERHKLRRTPYRVRAMLRLFSDSTGQPPCLLYTRHVNSQAMGFLSAKYLPLSHGGILRIPAQGKLLEIYCTILRCREAAPGWYEGAVYFNRQQPTFAAENLEP
jgi:hypothetical protein